MASKSNEGRCWPVIFNIIGLCSERNGLVVMVVGKDAMCVNVSVQLTEVESQET